MEVRVQVYVVVRVQGRVGVCVCDKSVDDKNSLVNLFLSVRYALNGVSLRE